MREREKQQRMPREKGRKREREREAKTEQHSDNQVRICPYSLPFYIAHTSIFYDFNFRSSSILHQFQCFLLVKDIEKLHNHFECVSSLLFLDLVLTHSVCEFAGRIVYQLNVRVWISFFVD